MVTNFGFTYFSAPEHYLQPHMNHWLGLLKNFGAEYVIFNANFDVAVPEDVISIAKTNGLAPIIHFNQKLPFRKAYSETTSLLEVYKKWGVDTIIVGDTPNLKTAWENVSWQVNTLVDRFLDEFIQLAQFAIHIGQAPILAPLYPGGDFWDTAFLELLLQGLKQRHEHEIIEHLILASYGITFNKPLSWGRGGFEIWPGVKAYQHVKDQENQIGFCNFEWVQAVSQRVFGEKHPVIILDAGNPTGGDQLEADKDNLLVIEELIRSMFGPDDNRPYSLSESISPKNSLMGITFSLDTIKAVSGKSSIEEFLRNSFPSKSPSRNEEKGTLNEEKIFTHYLLLPAYESGIPEVIINKVLPYVKAFLPTVGFSIDEASFAKKVTVYPDPYLFPVEKINYLRNSGCSIEILPETGIDIATLIQNK